MPGANSQSFRESRDNYRKARGVMSSAPSGQDTRIGNMAAAGLLFIALVFDLLSLIPFVGDLVGPVFWIGVSVYLWYIGCGFLNSRRLATTILSTVGEMIPVVQEFPLIFAGAVLIVVLVRLEDKTGISLTKNFSGKNPNLGQARKDFSEAYNQHGRREPQTDLRDGLPSDDKNRNSNTMPLNVDGVRQPAGRGVSQS